MIRHNEASEVYSCYRIGKNPDEELLIWTATQDLAKPSIFNFTQMDHSYQRDSEDPSKAKLVPNESKTKDHAIVPLPGNSVINILRPSIAMKEGNQRRYEMVEALMAA